MLRAIFTSEKVDHSTKSMLSSSYQCNNEAAVEAGASLQFKFGHFSMKDLVLKLQFTLKVCDFIWTRKGL